MREGRSLNRYKNICFGIEMLYLLYREIGQEVIISFVESWERSVLYAHYQGLGPGGDDS